MKWQYTTPNNIYQSSRQILKVNDNLEAYAIEQRGFCYWGLSHGGGINTLDSQRALTVEDAKKRAEQALREYCEEVVSFTAKTWPTKRAGTHV